MHLPPSCDVCFFGFPSYHRQTCCAARNPHHTTKMKGQKITAYTATRHGRNIDKTWSADENLSRTSTDIVQILCDLYRYLHRVIERLGGGIIIRRMDREIKGRTARKVGRQRSILIFQYMHAWMKKIHPPIFYTFFNTIIS